MCCVSSRHFSAMCERLHREENLRGHQEFAYTPDILKRMVEVYVLLQKKIKIYGDLDLIVFLLGLF